MSVARSSTACLFAVLGAAACVPATADLAPKGGVEVATVPTPASRGEPFVTADGWTIHVETFAVQMYVVAVPSDGIEGGFGGTYVFRGSEPEQFIVRAVPEGPTRTVVTLATRYLAYPPYLEKSSENSRIDSSLEARFDSPADDDPIDIARDPTTVPPAPPQAPRADGPAVVISARAEKAGRVVKIELGLAGSQASTEFYTATQANALTTVKVPVAAEMLFSETFTDDKSRLVFDDLAATDADGDGNISVAELRRVVVPPCNKCTDEQKRQNEQNASPMIEVLSNRAAAIFVPR